MDTLPEDFTVRASRKGRRRPLVWLSVLVLILAATAGLLVDRLALDGVTRARDRGETPTFSPPSTQPETARVSADLFPSGKAYPLQQWSLRTSKMGFIDDAVIQSATATHPGPENDVLVLKGWTGHTAMGMRLPYVIFSICDQVVGAVPVNAPRPDVAEAIHRNLTHPGWTARIPVGFTPKCPDPVLKAYGVGPVGKNAWPLGSDAPLPDDAPRAPTTLTVDYAAPVITPETFGEAVFGAIRIKVSVANLRQCPSTDCAVVDKRTHGVYKSLIIEQSGDWSLVQFQDGAGWLHGSLFQKR